MKKITNWYKLITAAPWPNAVIEDGNVLAINNSFMIKDDLKAMGFLYNADKKNWYMGIGKVDDSVISRLISLRVNFPPPNAAIDEGGNVLEINNYFMIKDALKAMGFLYNLDKKNWYMEIGKVDKSVMSRLISLFKLHRVDFPQPIVQMIEGKVSPSNQRPQYVLALAKDLIIAPVGEPVVVIEVTGKDILTAFNRNGESQNFPKVDAKGKVEAIRENGKPFLANTKEELFKIYDAKFGKKDESEGNEQAKSGESEKIKGRISADKISPYQKKIEESFTNSENDIVIDALAGTGKTSVLKHIASYKKPEERWLYLVFNKKNQIESKGQFPKGVEVSTSHSFLTKRLESLPAGLMPSTEMSDFDKVGSMVDDVMEMSSEIPKEFDSWDSHLYPRGKVFYNGKESLKKIVDMCKANSVDANDENIDKIIENIIRTYSISTDIQNKDKKGNSLGPPIVVTKELIKEAKLILKECLPRANLERYKKVPNDKAEDGYVDNTLKYKGTRSFDDILWYSSLYSKYVKWPKYDVVLADEVQDFNKCQQIMLENLRNTGARVVAVGDPFQSIYAFRGADSNSFSKVKAAVIGDEQEAHRLPVNYRCGKKIIDYVNGSELSPVKNLQAGVSYDGEVFDGRESQDESINFVIKEYKSRGNKLKTPTAFIARGNSVLQEVALKLIAANVKFEFIGNNISKKLLELCSVIVGKKNQKNMEINEFIEKLYAHIDDYIVKYEHSIKMKDKVSEKKNAGNAISSIITNLRNVDARGRVTYVNKDVTPNREIQDSKEFLQYLRLKFKGLDFERDSDDKIDEFIRRDPHDYVALCSAHRSKGLEFERVYILNRDDFPSKRAESKMAEEQEANTWYVALTRAKNELHLPLAPKDHEDDDSGGW